MAGRETPPVAAAGLAATWLYKKARVLAIFDDLDTVLLMIPLKMMLIGFEPKLLVLVLAVFLFLAAAYFCIHWLAVPTSNGWVEASFGFPQPSITS